MRRDHAFVPVLRDALLVAAVAVVTVQALRRLVGDRYMVPSDSMQPVLHGDPLHGDVVFVDKLGSAAARRRHDLVVVVHPEHGDQQLVKRIAARGDDHDACWIDLRGGDIWLGPDRDPKRFRRDTKEPFAARAMRVEWAAWPARSEALATALDLSAGTEVDGELRVPASSTDAAEATALFTAEARQRRRSARARSALPAGFVGTARPVDASFVDASGVRGRAGDDIGVVDCGMDLELALPVEILFGTVELLDQSLTLVWRAAAGGVELWCEGERVGGATLPCRPQGAHRIEFGLLDDRVFFAVDDRLDALFVMARSPDWPQARPTDAAPQPRTYVHLGTQGGAPLRLTRLTVWRDVFHDRERIAGFAGDRGAWPRSVPPGAWFLLGDNTYDSRDSRQFDAVPATAFVGVPQFVIGPWERAHWLPR
ncbi:MAG: hypothetical protein JNL08_21475 [Planctomycetes bacterium]|nr:hypothetical protein [Planctomycetota bacterium]